MRQTYEYPVCTQAIRTQAARCLAVLAILSTAGMAQETASPTPPAQTPPATTHTQPAAASLPGDYTSAEALLTALENADKGLTALQADILLHRTFVIEGDEQQRWGKLYFRQVADPASNDVQPLRQFSVRFDTRRIGDRLEEKEQKFVFDGRWLAELNPDEKRFSRRELVPPGETFDPLRIGEGPLPIPIGQRKDDILARFSVELVAPDAGIDDSDNPRQAQEWRKFVAGTYQLRLLPKVTSSDDAFTEIRLWYKPAAKVEGTEDGRLIPRMARTINHAGDVTTVQLVNVKTNFEIGPEYFSTDAPAEGGWDTTIIPYRKPSAQSPDLPQGPSREVAPR
ncbi:MAG TPA: hypothetical protein VK176_14820 [Phycisphaerales bacterium]|nr:hypothetical protein [Phycisphaerales bacterium]